MVKIYTFINSNLKIVNIDESNIDDIPAKDDVVWIDMFNPTNEEFKIIEKFFDIEFPTKQETEEIEISSRYWETDKDLTVNSYFLVVDGDTVNNETVTFILQDNFLVTIRYRELRAFGECVKKIVASPSLFKDGSYILSYIFEVRIDLDADILETLSRNVSNLRKMLFSDNKDDQEILQSIYNYENINTNIRDSLIDKQRIISSFLKSHKFAENVKNNFRIMIKDVNSLLDFTRYNFDRLDYIQDLLLGSVNIEQNKIIKIFTVVNVIFLPPTLVASVYGMNFDFFPEIHWRYGYLFAWVIMILSAILPLYIFKKKGWL